MERYGNDDDDDDDDCLRICYGRSIPFSFLYKAPTRRVR